MLFRLTSYLSSALAFKTTAGYYFEYSQGRQHPRVQRRTHPQAPGWGGGACVNQYRRDGMRMLIETTCMRPSKSAAVACSQQWNG